MNAANRLKFGVVPMALAPLLAAACSSSSSGHGAHSPVAHSSAAPIAVHGTVTLTDPDSTLNALLTGTSDCSGVGGYSDIQQGAEVVISDDAGKTLTITHLGAGKVPQQSTGISHKCVFRFTASVPAGHGFYGVEVTHRGVVKMTEADLSTAALSIGQ